MLSGPLLHKPGVLNPKCFYHEGKTLLLRIKRTLTAHGMPSHWDLGLTGPAAQWWTGPGGRSAGPESGGAAAAALSRPLAASGGTLSPAEC